MASEPKFEDVDKLDHCSKKRTISIRQMKHYMLDVTDASESLFQLYSDTVIFTEMLFSKMTIVDRLRSMLGEVVLAVALIELYTVVIASYYWQIHRAIKQIIWSLFIPTPALAQSPSQNVDVALSIKQIALILVFGDWFIVILITIFCLWGAFVRQPAIAAARELLRTILAFATGQMTAALAVLGFVVGAR